MAMQRVIQKKLTGPVVEVSDCEDDDAIYGTQQEDGSKSLLIQWSDCVVNRLIIDKGYKAVETLKTLRSHRGNTVTEIIRDTVRNTSAEVFRFTTARDALAWLCR